MVDQNLEELMKQSQDGDQQACTALLVQCEKMARAYVNGFFNLLQPDDVVQEILLSIYTKRHTYDPRRPFKPWFYALVRYKSIDFLRSTRKHRSLLCLDELGGKDIPLSEEISSAGWDLEKLLSELPAKQQEAIRRVKLEGKSIKQVSQELGLSPSDIKVSVHRALKKLRDLQGRAK